MTCGVKSAGLSETTLGCWMEALACGNAVPTRTPAVSNTANDSVRRLRRNDINTPMRDAVKLGSYAGPATVVTPPRAPVAIVTDRLTLS